MFNLFKKKKCEHPAYALHVEKDATYKRLPQYDLYTKYGSTKYSDVTYHLYCRICDEKIKIKHAKVIHE